MRLDHRLLHSEQQRSSAFIVVEFVFYFFEGFFQQHSAYFRTERRIYFFLQFCKNATDRPFHGLQCDIAVETVGHDNVVIARQNISRLHIADKIYPVAIFKQGESVFCQSIAFGIFGTVGQERDARICNAFDLAHIHTAHQGKLNEIYRFAIYVCSAVEKQRLAAFHIRKQRGERRSVHTLYSRRQQYRGG